MTKQFFYLLMKIHAVLILHAKALKVCFFLLSTINARKITFYHIYFLDQIMLTYYFLRIRLHVVVSQKQNKISPINI